jgi:hypothetical protein
MQMRNPGRRFKGEQLREPGCKFDFPLARYAARFWTQHARASDALSQQQRNLSIELLTTNHTEFETWIRFFDLRFAACQQGLTYVVYNILDCALADYNVQWKDEGSPLQAASLRGYEKIVELLLAKGANVDAKEGRSGSPLEAASLKDHENIVKMLQLCSQELPYRWMQGN